MKKLLLLLLATLFASRFAGARAARLGRQLEPLRQGLRRWLLQEGPGISAPHELGASLSSLEALRRLLRQWLLGGTERGGSALLARDPGSDHR